MEPELELCEECPLEEPTTPQYTLEEARLKLFQRCLDAGWPKSKAEKYLNRVLPLPEKVAS